MYKSGCHADAVWHLLFADEGRLGTISVVVRGRYMASGSEESTVERAQGSTGGGRNSSFELLRLIAMYMIILHHHVIHNPFPVYDESASLNQFIYVCFMPLGKVAVDIFFGISAWFLCEARDSSLRKSLRRIWVLERQILFYSLPLMVCFVLFDRKDISRWQILNSVFPTISGIWWYPTNYVLFLLFYPFVTMGLRKMGRSMHGLLVVILLLVWGLVYGLTPSAYAGFLSATFVSFIYQYVLIAYYRWYLKKAPKALGWSMIGLGSLAIIGVVLFGDWVRRFTHSGYPRIIFNYINAEGKLPLLLVAFGALLVADTIHFKSRLINHLAKGTFGIYLLHDYPSVRLVLWDYFDIRKTWGQHYTVVYSLVMVFLVFLVCLVVDLIRDWLFTLTIDRHKGRWFDLLADWLQSSPAVGRCKQYLQGLQRGNSD